MLTGLPCFTVTVDIMPRRWLSTVFLLFHVDSLHRFIEWHVTDFATVWWVMSLALILFFFLRIISTLFWRRILIIIQLKLLSPKTYCDSNVRTVVVSLLSPPRSTGGSFNRLKSFCLLLTVALLLAKLWMNFRQLFGISRPWE